MCDYSLESVENRPAKVGDRLTSRDFGTGTRGFCAVITPYLAICLSPGTEIGFDKGIKISTQSFFRPVQELSAKVAIFRKIGEDISNQHHDALELPDGTIIPLTILVPGQLATVLQISRGSPAQSIPMPAPVDLARLTPSF